MCNIYYVYTVFWVIYDVFMPSRVFERRKLRVNVGKSKVISNRGLGIKAKKCINEGVIVPMALSAAEAWGMRSVERRKVNVLEMKCLRTLVGVSRMEE